MCYYCYKRLRERERATADILFPVENCRVSVEVLVQFEVDEEQPEQTHSGHFTLKENS